MNNDHDLLIELRTKLDFVLTKLDSVRADHADHEGRLRTLEAHYWKNVGGAAVAAFLTTTLVLLAKYILVR